MARPSFAIIAVANVPHTLDQGPAGAAHDLSGKSFSTKYLARALNACQATAEQGSKLANQAMGRPAPRAVTEFNRSLGLRLT